MERKPSVYHQPSKVFDRRRSFRDIQGVISKMNPEILKSVIGSVEHKSGVGKCVDKHDALALNPMTLKHHESVFPPAFGGNACGLESATETSPLTIFYNGAVAVFDLPRRRAEDILKLAASSKDPNRLFDTHNRNLPITRGKSLQRFLEKRKERLNLASRYGCPAMLSGQKSAGY